MTTTKFYYVRRGEGPDSKGVPVATVCLIKTDVGWARGVAVCSVKDSVSKRTGRNIARGKALKAIKRGLTSSMNSSALSRHNPVVQEQIRSIISDNLILATPEATLTTFELKITAANRPQITE